MMLSINYETILLRSIKMVICLIPFLPLFIAPSVMYPYVTGKNFAFRILIEVASVLYIWLIVLNKHYRPSNSVMSIAVFIFTLVVGLADIFGTNPYNSFWSTFERMEGYITILHLAFFFMIIRAVFQSRSDWKIYFSLCLMVSMLVSLFTFIEPFILKQSGVLKWINMPPLP